MFTNTICAIATALGQGGIGIVRISGNNAFDVIKKIFRPKGKIDYNNIKTHTIKYGHIVDNDRVIDEVLVSFFKSPNSYTKEDIAEINCHGGNLVLREILDLCLKNGADIASPGEFTKRAFLNGKIDLAQAEAIIDVITAKTKVSLRTSVNQLEGKLSQNIKGIKEMLLDILIQIEAAIDYPEHDIEEYTKKSIYDKIEIILNNLKKLIDTFEEGKILREGIKTTIVGKPNVGKSSLLNALLKEERAIVTDVAGTTRDVIEEFINIRGIPIKLLDTAGIRKTLDVVEEMGVTRAIKNINDSDLVICVFDNSQALDNDDFKIIDIIKEKNVIIIINKIDLEQNLDVSFIEEALKNNTVIKLSAKENIGIEYLEEKILEMYNLNAISLDNEIIITNLRHKDLIMKCYEELKNAKQSMETDIPIDMVSIEIRDSALKLAEITGETVTDEVINGIFSRFCLGK